MRVLCFISYSQANHSLRFIEFATELRRQLTERLAWTADNIDFDGYFPSEFLASALDPRTKDLTFLSEENQGKVLITPTSLSLFRPPHLSPQVWKKLSELVESLGGDSVEIGDSESSQRASTRHNPATVTSSLSVVQLMREKKRSRQGRTGSRISEVDLFRKIESIDFQCDPYEWWKLHEGTFPRIATLAKVLFFINCLFR